MKITEYDILSDHDAGGLASEVEKYIADGWQPYGPPQVVCPVIEVGPAPCFYQAMVRYEEKKTPLESAYEKRGPLRLDR
jgi:hypothetical protein